MNYLLLSKVKSFLIIVLKKTIQNSIFSESMFNNILEKLENDGDITSKI